MKFLAQPIVSWYRGLLRHSKYRWVVILGSLAYLLSPVDLVTDLVPVAGWIDDGLLATVLVAEVSQLLLEQRRDRQAKRLQTDISPVQ
ncbi:MAG: YkvA family protein [Thermosynechococcaceae cyanobacterium]